MNQPNFGRLSQVSIEAEVWPTTSFHIKDDNENINETMRKPDTDLGGAGSQLPGVSAEVSVSDQQQQQSLPESLVYASMSVLDSQTEVPARQTSFVKTKIRNLRRNFQFFDEAHEACGMLINHVREQLRLAELGCDQDELKLILGAHKYHQDLITSFRNEYRRKYCDYLKRHEIIDKDEIECESWMYEKHLNDEEGELQRMAVTSIMQQLAYQKAKRAPNIERM